ncbi:hypothetical protein HanXRQr2_Chr08g0336771 [Helianthus annuus]|uniref:Protein RFT1 homolog n=1 Tax=Helianthus annuus TaxID=4232 RepID=A0A9K3IEK5_HELAN|nr:hypothetical protein HanXRQr2_Chr08g0336771 [Helianthus annuus]KAJ0546697.1 hypothetical protein HanIR_Chr08g0363811 [Helianthus annuus]KAJ0901443.1 hypothetical protein HanPSC8_Chr08g0325361 [Helianthus annuus]
MLDWCFMAFGPSYSYSLIRVFYGRKWSDGEAIAALKYYCLYDSPSFLLPRLFTWWLDNFVISSAVTLVSGKSISGPR